MEDKRNQISDWLEKLQRESWNLELLISGFSIFLLIQTGSAIIDLLREINFHTDLQPMLRGLVISFLGLCQLAAYLLTFNLIVHVLLRGFWIGAIGLRSVQDRIEYEKLKYSQKFTKHLEKSTFNLDNLLIRLDNVCSVIFAFTFLIVFMLFSLFLAIAFMALVIFLVSKSFEWIGVEGLAVRIIQGVFFFSMVLTGLIYALDTLTLGFFKKFKWTSKVFFPIHRFWGAITMAKIYRGIYYSLISRFSKKQIRLFLAPVILLIVFTPFFKFDQYVFFPDLLDTPGFLRHTIYEDQLKEGDLISRASIPSLTTAHEWMSLFIRYDVQFNEDIYKHCEDYRPSKKPGLISGIRFDNGIQLSSPNVQEEDPEKLKNCLSSYYAVYLNDSLYNDLDFYFYRHPHREEQGIITVLPTGHLPKGKNLIHIQRRVITESDSLREDSYVQIPFWLQ